MGSAKDFEMDGLPVHHRLHDPIACGPAMGEDEIAAAHQVTAPRCQPRIARAGGGVFPGVA